MGGGRLILFSLSSGAERLDAERLGAERLGAERLLSFSACEGGVGGCGNVWMSGWVW